MTLKRHSEIGGAREDRTPDLLRARQALSQLSYGPFLLVFLSLCGVVLVTRSVTYAGMLLRSFLRTPCLTTKILRKNLLFDSLQDLISAKFSLIKANERVVCNSHMSAHLTPGSGNLVGLGGFEPPTSPLSGVRSNQLSYRPGVTTTPAWAHKSNRYTADFSLTSLDQDNLCGHSRRRL